MRPHSSLLILIWVFSMRGTRFRRVTLVVAALIATVGARTELAAQAAPTVTIRGTVRASDSSEPIPAASVLVKGTTIGTQTSDSGAFTLRVPNPNATLVFSRIGFARQEVALAGRTTIDLRLTRTAVSLSEVVVVGYGTQKRSDITGSVTSIGPERLEEKPNSNFVQALEGSMPGVTVTTSGAGSEPGLSIQVRGRNSISASTSPLVVVDGIPYNGPLTDISPADIGSLEVLKDASATAIYGTRGSNGVILVTTKKGAPGKTRFNYDGQLSSHTYSNIPRLMNASEFFDFKCVRLRTNPTQTCEGLLTATELRNYKAGVNTDWVRLGTQNGKQQQHVLTLSGGSDDTRYYVAGDALKVDGVAINDVYNRVTMRVNFDQKIRSWLSFGTANNAVRTIRDGVPASFGTAFTSNPLISPYDSAGNQVRVPWPEDPITANVLENLLAQNEDLNKRLFSSNYVQLSIPQVEGLTYRLNAGLDLADANSSTYFGRNTQVGFTNNGRGDLANTRRNDWTLENVFRLARTYGRGTFDLTGVLSEAATSLAINSSRSIGYPNDVLGARSTLPLSIVPNIDDIESRLVSQVGRLNYSFNERYLLTATVRRDGFSGFGRNNKYGVFPTLAVGWNVANESFFPWKESVDALKLRFSYGKTGNQAIRPYQTFAQLDDRSYLNGEVTAPGYNTVTLGNPDLKWESTTSKNLAMDLSMWHDRMRATLEAYTASTSDLLLRRAISPVHGITSITQNIGKTANRGVDFQLTTSNVDRPSFEWHTDFNLSANRNKIVDLYGTQTDDINNGWFIGMPIDVNYGFKFDGIFQTADSASGAIARSAQPTAKPGYIRAVDINGDGKIDALDRTFIGSLEPSYTAGLTNTVRVGKLTLSAFFNTVQGVTRTNDLLATNQTFTDVRRNMVFREWWTPANPINSYPANSNFSNPLG
ncbi:MAG: SusC/RagA family TonB-linked outer membrane protein, partial [Gemmatimonadaceae bacterium]|nr:SusC/RagA family TonB-linked outer membrane protein [Gemmatimonadaceae bacterium]